jgi:hypothetical protein
MKSGLTVQHKQNFYKENKSLDKISLDSIPWFSVIMLLKLEMGKF